MKVSKQTPRSQVVFKTKDVKDQKSIYKWWLAQDKKALCNQILSTAAYLKESQISRQRQTAIYARLYGNMPLYSYIGSNISRMDQNNGLPADRPTFNLVQSSIDTLVSRIGQSKPAPTFLTDNGDYKQRNLAKQLNNFILGEIHQTKAYEKVNFMLRDALVTGTGVIKVFETPDAKVGLDRVLMTELFTDPNESIYGEPRQIFQLKLVDRSVLEDNFPGYGTVIEQADTAYPDNSADSSKSVSDLVMVVEGWHLKSGPDAKDGRHTIACSAGIILDEDYEKNTFPFVFLHYSPRIMGFWSQGAAEQLMGTQLEINSLLFTISKAIKLVGVPRVFVEESSKVVSAHFTNDVGAIVKYRGTKPEYEVAPCVPQELYAQLERLIKFGYQQIGVSAMDAGSQKPAGLNSGEAIRSYDAISTDRMATLSKKYDNVYVDLAYLIIDKAKEIAERDKKYQTVYPGKNGTSQIDLPKADLIEDNPFVIQCMNMSSLPKDPAGRMEKVAEMIQSGMITVQEGRRLLDFPDLDQVEKLANASQERILKILDEIIDEGKYTSPDPFMNLELATQLVTQYYNLYSANKLEEVRCQMLRDFFSQVLALKQAAMPPAMPEQGAPTPQAAPQAPPTSPLVPNTPEGA